MMMFFDYCNCFLCCFESSVLSRCDEIIIMCFVLFSSIFVR